MTNLRSYCKAEVQDLFCVVSAGTSQSMQPKDASQSVINTAAAAETKIDEEMGYGKEPDGITCVLNKVG